MGVIADSKKAVAKLRVSPGKALDPAMLLRDEETTDALEGTVQSFSVSPKHSDGYPKDLRAPVYTI